LFRRERQTLTQELIDFGQAEQLSTLPTLLASLA